MNGKLINRNRLTASLLCFCSLCVGAFFAIRLRAFLIMAWSVSLPVWFLWVFTAGAALIPLFTGSRVAGFLKHYAHSDSPAFYFVTAVCIALCAIFRNTLIYKPLAGTGVYPGKAALLASVAGAGFLLSIFTSFALSAAKKGFKHVRKLFSSLTLKDYIFFTSLLVLLNLFARLYINSCQTIYFWDNAGYWTKTHVLAEEARQGIMPYLRFVYDSILTQDYNYLIAVPWTPLVLLFGPSRWVFIAGIINLALFPILVLLYAYISSTSRRPVLSAACVILSLPMLFYTAVTGFIDMAGVVFTLTAALLWLTDKGKNSLERFFVIGCLLAVAVLLRRWYAFFAVSFFIALFTDAVFFRKSPLAIVTTAASFAFSLIFFFQPLAAGRLLKNYASTYSAYSLPLGVDIRYIFYYFGVFVMLLNALGIILMLMKKQTRPEGVFLLVQPLACFVTFVCVQTHGQQHLLLYIPSLVCVLSFLYSNLPDRITGRKTIPAVMLAFALFPFLNPFLNNESHNSIADITSYHILPSFNYKPPVRPDADEIVTLIRYLDETAGKHGSSVGILASSFALNRDILKNAEISLNLKRISDVDRGYIVWLPEVDGRDAFPGALFDCDYLLVALPVQIHLGEENQSCIVLPASQVLGGVGFGQAYARVGETFYVGSNESIEVRLYKKTREITEEEKESLLTAYENGTL